MLLLIDGDVLAYQACKPRWEGKAQTFVSLNESGEAVTKPVMELDAEGNKVEYEFTADEDRRYLEESWKTFKNKLQELLDANYASDYMMAVKGEENFRNLLYPEYKLHRHDKVRTASLFVPALRQLAVLEGMAIASHGREADDLLRIWAEEARSVGREYVICTIDKDLRCIPGRHYLMHINLPDNKRNIIISEEEAMRHYYEQIIKGDPTDYIPGIPGVGEKKAAAALKNCKTEEDFQEAVVNAYFSYYGEELWYEYFLSNAKMIHLQKHSNDYCDVGSWPIIQELL